MFEETANKPLPVNSLVNEDDAGNNFGSESAMRATSSSPTCGATLMADGKILEKSDFFKKTIVTDTKR
jgi:hypothetical protein